MSHSPIEIRNIEVFKYNDFEGWLALVTQYLKTYPLILACSFVDHNSKANFKQEYIIPQMLMQWIYRNKDEIQGVSYFSCVDMSAHTSRWCAYNIAIPAFPPYDKSKYSIYLRNHFTWTDPVYYMLPTYNTGEKEQDVLFLFDYLQLIRSTANIQVMHNDIRNYLIKIWKLCGTLLKLIEKGDMVDNEVALNTMIVLREYISNSCVFPNDWTAESLMKTHRSRPYNPDIANTFFRAGYIEAWGRGVQKICEECGKIGAADPEYSVVGNDITVKLTAVIGQNNFNRSDDHLKVDLKRKIKITDALLKEIISILSGQPSITVQALSDQINLSYKTTQRALDILKEKGTIEREGSRKTGMWIVKK